MEPNEWPDMHRRRLQALRLRRARREAGLTQRQLAALAGVSRRTVQYAEQAARETQAETLGRLRAALRAARRRLW